MRVPGTERVFLERQVERGNYFVIDLQKFRTTVVVVAVMVVEVVVVVVVVVELAVFGSMLPVNFITVLEMLVLKMDFIRFIVR